VHIISGHFELQVKEGFSYLRNSSWPIYSGRDLKKIISFDKKAYEFIYLYNFIIFSKELKKY